MITGRFCDETFFSLFSPNFGSLALSPPKIWITWFQRPPPPSPPCLGGGVVSNTKYSKIGKKKKKKKNSSGVNRLAITAVLRGVCFLLTFVHVMSRRKTFPDAPGRYPGVCRQRFVFERETFKRGYTPGIFQPNEGGRESTSTRGGPRVPRPSSNNLIMIRWFIHAGHGHSLLFLLPRS